MDEEALKAVIATAVDAIFVMGPDGIILMANQAAERLFGYDPGELEGKPMTVIMPPPYDQEHQTYVERYLRTDRAKVIGKGGQELHGRRKDGSIVPLELAVSEAAPSGQRLFTGILRDISRRKRFQKNLVLSNSLLEKKQAQLDKDLAAAGEIQRSLLPSSVPSLANIALNWRFTPSASIGGDILDIIPLDNDHTGMYILDVSGHGVSSALVAVSVSQFLRADTGVLLDKSLAYDGSGTVRIRPPELVAEELDREFPLERFDAHFTIFYMVLNHRTGRIRYCSCGHPPPLLVRASGSVERLQAGGTIIGLGGVVPFHGGETAMLPGDVLLLYTDGCTEHADKFGQEVGEDRLTELVVEFRNESVNNILEAVETGLTMFSAEPFRDDVTLLCLKYTA